MDMNVLPLLSAIANGNNLGVNSLRRGNMDALRAIDVAISGFRGALAEITATLDTTKGQWCQAQINGANTVSPSIPTLTAFQEDNAKRVRSRRHSSIAFLLPRTRQYYRGKEPNTPSTSVHSPSASPPRTQCSIQICQTRDEALGSSEIAESATSHILRVHLSRKIGFVYEEPITIDLAEMRDMATSIMCFRILSTSEQQHSSHRCGECMLRECLINLSVIIVYNLGLAYHLKSRQQLAGCDSPERIATHSRSLINNLKKAQLLYSTVSRNMIRLPSLKYKLVLLNNMGQVYLDQNLREHAKKCFEAVCRQVTKSLYECSGRSVLLPPSSTVYTGEEALAFADTKLMRSLMITAINGLLPDPHAAIA